MLQKLVELLEERGITQAAFERKTGLSENRISKWKDGKGVITAKQAMDMARELEIPVLYLLDDRIDRLEETHPLTVDEVKILQKARKIGYIDAMRWLEAAERALRGDAGSPDPGDESDVVIDAIGMPSRIVRPASDARRGKGQPAHPDKPLP